MGKYDLKMVIVIDKSLRMRKGKICAQAAHAAMLFLRDGYSGPDKNELHLTQIENSWFLSTMAKIVVGCDSLEELQQIASNAKAAGLTAKFVTDAGATEFGGIPTVTCLGIGPDKSDKIDKITGHLKLL